MFAAAPLRISASSSLSALAHCVRSSSSRSSCSSFPLRYCFLQSSARASPLSRLLSSSSSMTDVHMNPAHSNPDPTEAHHKPPFKSAKEQESPGSEAQMNPKPDFGEKTYKGSGKLKDHVALITGADSGIGRAVALAFAREGADVAISYLNEHEDAKEIERWVKDAGRRCLLLPGDLSEEAQCRSIVEKTVQAFGRLDLLVNNAAFQGKSVKSITELDRQRVEYTFKTNILAMFSTVAAALPHMAKGGAIINTGSVQAYDPSAEILDYATTKAAIVGFTKGLAAELVPKGIRVNCVAPGPVWTPLVMASFPTEKLKTFGAHYPIGRPAQPAELATAYVFLASQESRYVNAAIIPVTGGEPTA